PAVVALLQDAEPDVVLQAVLILERMRDPRALEPLHAALAHPDPNVQQEALLAVGGLGDARSIPHLLPFLDADPWVQMAAVQALGDLRAPQAIPHLAGRLARRRGAGADRWRGRLPGAGGALAGRRGGPRGRGSPGASRARAGRPAGAPGVAAGRLLRHPLRAA